MDGGWADYGIAGLALGVLALAISQLARWRANGSSKSDALLVGVLDRNTKALEGLEATLHQQTEALTDLRVAIANQGAVLREHGVKLDEIRRNTNGRRSR